MDYAPLARTCLVFCCQPLAFCGGARLGHFDPLDGAGTAEQKRYHLPPLVTSVTGRHKDKGIPSVSAWTGAIDAKRRAPLPVVATKSPLYSAGTDHRLFRDL